ncbi:hypothetical protein [Ancylobacter sp.]|uniref:hypothetical protein n=1 Tax=Ancylobacter sp. TaxID=1872567 RepID=UPI003D097BB2
MYLSDLQRIEIALPAWILIGAITSKTVDLGVHRDEALELLRVAAREPLGDLSSDRSTKVIGRVRRLHQTALASVAAGPAKAEETGLLVFYWIKMLVESEYLIFSEGSSIDRALRHFILALQSMPMTMATELASHSQARAFLSRLQALGYYTGLDADAA